MKSPGGGCPAEERTPTSVIPTLRAGQRDPEETKVEPEIALQDPGRASGGCQ